MTDPKDLYYVAVKVFLEKDGKLFIFKDKFGDWDLPGGRIRKDEFDAPLESVIERKLREELGDDVRYELGKPVVFFRHERIEASSGQPVRIFGVGYRATVKGQSLEMGLGFSHPAIVEAPEGIAFVVEKNTLTISGLDAEMVGRVAAKIRALRPPEPYKGSGIKYKDEIIRRKAGKKAAGTTA